MGIDNVITTYRDSVKKVSLNVPTILTSTFEEFRLFVESTVGRKKYSVLLILIDGVITDSNQVKDEITKLANLSC